MKARMLCCLLALGLIPTLHLSAQELPSESLFRLGLTLETDAGPTIPFSSLQGRALLITLFYSECSSVCPMTTAELQNLERTLAPQARENVTIVMVSLDPVHDTPAALKRFRQEHHIDNPRWILARTSTDNVRALAAALGVRYRELPDHTINHSTVITLTDRNGVIDSRAVGWQAVDQHFLDRLQARAASRH
jgi:protein SCO1/2